MFRSPFAPLLLLALVGCSDSGSPPAPDGPSSTLVNASDVPLDGLSKEDVAKFNDGDALFGLPFRPADGLGPLFIRTACASCHAEGSRGPGLVQKMVVVEPDGVTPATDQSALAFGHTVRQGMAAGATTPIAPPQAGNVKVTVRLGPPVLGRGYIEAVDESELVRLEAAQAARSDAIHGQIGHTPYASVPNPDTSFSHYQQGQTGIIGRFGVKARVAVIDDFTADAFQGDMGMTTPMRPTELANPDGLADDRRAGVDLTQDHIDRISFYLRRIAIPLRVGLSENGAALFEQAACAVCHVPSLRTRASYPIAQLAGIDAPIYSDLLLHDMGAPLADGMTDGGATATAWRTAPLIGLRFQSSYLHDGRAQSVADAVLAHDGEAREAARAFSALSEADQRTLIEFVEAL
ncbi:MAG TPA: di-heme oxidoredictase family protein [Kofleriaceae bacterium]|nr:di-heme oxidoredictase family protein [Kofleriaceae bacterium]